MPTKKNFYGIISFQNNTGIGKDYCTDWSNEPLTEKSNKLEKKSETREEGFTGESLGLVIYDPKKDELYTKKNG